MANYLSMTYGQTCFIRNLRRTGEIPDENSMPQKAGKKAVGQQVKMRNGKTGNIVGLIKKQG